MHGTIVNILLTIGCAVVIGYLFYRLKVPGGMMIGAVIGACIYNLISQQAYLPVSLKTLAQIITGAFIGARIGKDEIKGFRQIIKPALIIYGSLLLINLVCGFLIYSTGCCSLVTAMLSSAPGGISDMPIIGADMGADCSIIVIMQFVRLMMGIGLFPMTIRFLRGSQEQEKCLPVVNPGDAKASWKAMFVTLLVATVFGLIQVPIPAGTMVMASIGTIALKYFYPRAQIQKSVRLLAQLASGAYVGQSISFLQLQTITTLWKPVLILLGCYSLGCFGIASILKKRYFTSTEAMLASTPAGAGDIAQISADLGVENPKLVLIQILRLIVVISIFPTIIQFVSNVAGSYLP